jgi:magnesium transporter
MSAGGEPMIRILYRNERDLVNTQLQVDALAEALKDPTGLLWIDMAIVPMETTELILAKTFGFHPLAIEDAVHESHVPKVDDWEEYLYVVLRAVDHSNSESDHLQIPELDVFLGPNFVVTYYQEPIATVDRVWEICQKDQRCMKRGAGHLLYRLADELVSEAVAAVDQMHDELDQIEDQLFAEAGQDTLENLFTLKRNVLQLRRIVVPHRDVLNKLARNEYPTIRDIDRIFFRDVYDHLLQLNGLLDDMLILISGALDTYLSLVNNRMNDVMKTLTVITALYMPLAFITGFFGMNFFQARVVQLEAWTSALSFAVALVIMIFIPILMFRWMKRRSWI